MTQVHAPVQQSFEQQAPARIHEFPRDGAIEMSLGSVATLFAQLDEQLQRENPDQWAVIRTTEAFLANSRNNSAHWDAMALREGETPEQYQARHNAYEASPLGIATNAASRISTKIWESFGISARMQQLYEEDRRRWQEDEEDDEDDDDDDEDNKDQQPRSAGRGNKKQHSNVASK